MKTFIKIIKKEIKTLKTTTEINTDNNYYSYPTLIQFLWVKTANQTIPNIKIILNFHAELFVFQELSNRFQNGSMWSTYTKNGIRDLTKYEQFIIYITRHYIHIINATF